MLARNLLSGLVTCCLNESNVVSACLWVSYRFIHTHAHTRTRTREHSEGSKVCSDSEAGSYLRLIDSYITQLKAQRPSRTCNERKEEEEKKVPPSRQPSEWDQDEFQSSPDSGRHAFQVKT